MANRKHKPYVFSMEDARAGGRAGTGAKKARSREQCQKAVQDRERRKRAAEEERAAERTKKLLERLKR